MFGWSLPDVCGLQSYELCVLRDLSQIKIIRNELKDLKWKYKIKTDWQLKWKKLDGLLYTTLFIYIYRQTDRKGTYDISYEWLRHWEKYGTNSENIK